MAKFVLPIKLFFNLNTMTALHPQYITDTAGKTLVVLSLKEFDTIMEELEEFEDIRIYDEVNKEDDGQGILFRDYIKKRSLRNA